MPNTTPNLGLVLSLYADQEHREYDANWLAIDAASLRSFTVGVSPGSLPLTASITTDYMSSSPLWAFPVNNVLFLGQRTLGLTSQPAIVSLDVSGLSARTARHCRAPLQFTHA